LEILETEGFENVIERHNKVAEYCRKRGQEIGLILYPKSCPSPTTTAFYIPKNWTWPKLNSKLRERRVCVGGSYGSLSGIVFRIGHMGTQANLELVKKAFDILEEVLKSEN